MNYGSSVYRDTQTITIQEMPERSPPGQLPRAVDILLEDDLVDQVKPGDRISISGIYRAIGSAFNGVVPATFRAMVLANNIQFINQNGAGSDLSAVAIKAVDIKNFKKISKRRDLFDLMARSLAPSIYGHEFIKKAILLMLFGGVEKNLENGTHLRG
jgi:DNA replication licensing factor MCM3